MQFEQYKQEAERILEHHTYACEVDKPGLEIWTCKRPDTSIWAFQIIVSWLGISVIGDFDHLSFRVGLPNYGLGFLAGSDVGYYIHSKLEHDHQTTEFCEESFKDTIAQGFCEWFNSVCEVPEPGDDHYTFGEYDGFPTVHGRPDVPQFILDSEGGKHFDDIEKFIPTITNEQWIDMGLIDTGKLHIINQWDYKYDTERKGKSLDSVEQWQKLFEDAKEISDTHYGYRLLEEFKPYYFDPCDEIRITRKSVRKMQDLYIVNLAAKRIMGIKNEQVKTTC